MDEVRGGVPMESDHGRARAAPPDDHRSVVAAGHLIVIDDHTSCQAAQEADLSRSAFHPLDSHARLPPTDPRSPTGSISHPANGGLSITPVCGPALNPNVPGTVPENHIVVPGWKKRPICQKIVLCQALKGLSARKRELVNDCVYTRGMRLEFPEMRKLIKSAFGPSKDPCCIFVHKLNSCDIGGGYMKVVERIEERAGQMDASGAMLLVDDLGTQIEAAFKKSLYGRLVIQWDFRKYAVRLNLQVYDVVVITFHKGTGSPTTKVWFSFIA